MNLTIPSQQQLDSATEQLFVELGCSYICFHNYNQAFFAIQNLSDVDLYRYFAHVLVTISLTGKLYDFISQDFC